VHSDFPNTDLQKVFENKVKRVQACIDARGHHFQHLFLSTQRFSERTVEVSIVEPTRYTFCFQFITNQQPLRVSSTICSSSGGTVYAPIGVFCVYNVDWLLPGLEFHLVLSDLTKIVQTPDRSWEAQQTEPKHSVTQAT
jgi:hypothetical protein